MPVLDRNFERLVARYHGPEGDAFALEELAPVAARVLPPGGRALEVGCGYGRNLVALASLPGARVVGCDVSGEELARACARIGALPEEQQRRVALV
ncbi:MAG TPA: class I SAM-dependent methyltransferase, partial [Candidatus Limnocylindria bacterium]|nr:class I SAM-dependent methyltransferase [Candidatus Limnocylindria bacterium]